MFPTAEVYATVSDKDEKVKTTIALRCFMGVLNFTIFIFIFKKVLLKRSFVGRSARKSESNLPSLWIFI